MWKYVGRRLIQLLPVLLGVSVLVFFGMHLIPGDVVVLLLGEKASAAELERLRHQLGLDQPIYIQYLRFLADALRGDFGDSIRTRQPVIWEIQQALPVTIELSLAALTFAVILGITIGVISARRPHSAARHRRHDLRAPRRVDAGVLDRDPAAPRLRRDPRLAPARRHPGHRLDDPPDHRHADHRIP